MEKIYRLTPAIKDNIWGGNKLREYGKTTEKDRIAESWELSFTDGGEARIENGRQMSESFPKESWVTASEKFHAFPVLTKFIDAKDKLSVQVHPSDEYALANEGQFGKTEMWYVVDAEEGAGLYMGLERECDREEFANRERFPLADEVICDSFENLENYLEPNAYYVVVSREHKDDFICVSTILKHSYQ